MRPTHLFSITARTGVSLRLFRRPEPIRLALAGVLLSTVHLFSQTPVSYTPKALLAADPRVFTAWLETHRPPQVAPDEKARILATLPSEGEITDLDDAGRQKLAALKQLLQATGRDAAYEVKVTDVTYARIGVFARSVVLISKPALIQIDAEDLQALAAHEIGHEYFTVEYERALSVPDHRRLKDLELLCDAFAIVTLRRLGMNPDRLLSGAEKITRYNQKLFAWRIDDRAYPTVAERRRFAREITAWLHMP
jgi:hypothetical protein